TRLTARPTSMPTISSGATTVSAVTSVERPRSSAKASSIGSQAAANDRVREATTRFQPSTSTNSSTFNGVDTMTGGSVNMPIEINSDDTIRSIATNGRNNAKPIWKAVLISESTNAGTTTWNGTSAGVAGAGVLLMSSMSCRSAVRV